MLRIDEILRELATIREDTFNNINAIKQKKSTLPVKLEELKQKVRQSNEQMQALYISLGVTSLPSNTVSTLIENKDHFFYQHNLGLKMAYYNFGVLIFLKALGYSGKLAKSNNNLAEIDAARANCKKIDEVVARNYDEIKKEITALHLAAKEEGDKSYASVSELIEKLDGLHSLYKNGINLLFEQMNLDYKILTQIAALKSQLANNQNTQADKDRSLRLAALGGSKPIIEILMDHGADITACGDKFKKNPLHFVCEDGNVDCFKALIKNQPLGKILKALSAKDSTNKTPRDYINALANGDKKLQMLKLIQVLSPNRVASNLRKLRSMSFGKAQEENVMAPQGNQMRKTSF